MEIKRVIIFTVFIILASCKTNFSIQQEDVVNSKQLSDDEIFRLYKFTRSYDIKYFFYLNKKIVDNSFKPTIYTYVRPLKENSKEPEKIYSPQGYYKKSVEYFRNELNGTNVTYLVKDNKIIFRSYYHDYSLDNRKQDKPKNIDELKAYLNKKRINYKVLKEGKKESLEFVNIMVGQKYYKIFVNSNMCNSYSVYNQKDSINIENFNTQINNFYW